MKAAAKPLGGFYRSQDSSSDYIAITQDTQEQKTRSSQKKSGTRVGQRKPKRDTVGHESQSEAI